MRTVIDETKVETYGLRRADGTKRNGMRIRIPLTFRVQADLHPGDKIQLVEDSDNPGELIVRKAPTSQF